MARAQDARSLSRYRRFRLKRPPARDRKRAARGPHCEVQTPNDYALRALTFLAAKGAPATTDEIAGHFGISSAHLGRVIRRLQAMGFMKAVRGRKGGVRLARDPAVLTLGEVIGSLEDNGQLMDGLAPGQVAGAFMARLAAVLRRASGMFSDYLARVTFAELAADGMRPEVPSNGDDGMSSDPLLEDLLPEHLDHPLPAAGRSS